MSENNDPKVAGLVATLRRNVSVIGKNTAGVTQAHSLLSVAEGGSTLNWVIGHIVASRDGMLKVLGSETTWDAKRTGKYQRGSTVPAGADVDEMSELLLELDRSQELLEGALAGVTAGQLAEPSGNRDNSKQEWLDFLAWHESYHVGQTAVYRRLAGLAGGTLG